MKETHVPARNEQSVPRAALKVTLGGLVSLLAGLASQILTAYLFGAGKVMDAFFTASIIPTFIQFSLLGWLPFVLIPAFIREQAAGREEDAWALLGTYAWISSGFFVLLAVLGLMFAPQIIAVVAPGFAADKSALAAQMLAVLIFTIPLNGWGTLTTSVENIRGRFFWPATATAAGSVGNVLTLLVLYPSQNAMALAWGGLVAAALQASVTAVPVLRHGWKHLLHLDDPRLRELVALSAPFVVFGFITNSRSVLERIFASSLPTGQLSYIGYAYKLSNIFVVLLASGISAAIFPKMAREYQRCGISGLIDQTDYGLKVTLATAFPAVMISSAVALPLVKVFYERGAFLPATAIGVSLLIPIAMFNDVLFRMVANIIARSFFVLKDTLTTNLTNSVTILLYVALAFFLTQKWGYIGLAAAQPIQAAVAILIISGLLVRRMKGFPVRELIKYSLLYVGISLMAAGLSWGVVQWTAFLPTFLQLLLGIAVGGSVYLGLLSVVDKSIARAVFEMIGLQHILRLVGVQMHHHTLENP
jgi:putative peptidoglycan lipid II flippase